MSISCSRVYTLTPRLPSVWRPDASHSLPVKVSMMFNLQNHILGAYGVGDIVWVKTSYGRCTTKFRMDRVTQVNSPRAIQIDGIPCHVMNLRLFMGSKPSSVRDNDSEDWLTWN